jgi:hypothetical protein
MEQLTLPEHLSSSPVFCGSCNSIFRERPFNLKGRGYVFFLKKYSDFGEGKKNNLIQIFLSYILMLNSEEKKFRFARQKK